MDDKIKLKSWEERGHRTFWWSLKRIYNIDRPTKYCVIFNTYTDKPGSFSVTPFDTLEEAMEEAKLINIMYSDTPKPNRNYHKKGKYTEGKCGNKYDLDYSNGAYFWGYMVLDMINNKVIKIVNTIKHCGFTFDSKITLDKLDILFRGDDEIPDDYIWDKRGEYEGWLQFRWGDGKNSINYIEPEIIKKQKQRTIIVNWEDPLPIKEDGVKYIRPNNEPVLFPGDFGYEGDEDNPYQWSLTEELAEEEYIDNGGKLDKKETTSSIADILGDDNPLLKLKFNYD